MLLAVLLVAGLLAGASGSLYWLRHSRPAVVSPDGMQPKPQRNDYTPYRQEIRSNLGQLSRLASNTLKHLAKQNMQTFTADRDSPLLRRLVKLNLLNPMGSSAYPPHAYPFRIPDLVWLELVHEQQPARVDDVPATFVPAAKANASTSKGALSPQKEEGGLALHQTGSPGVTNSTTTGH